MAGAACFSGRVASPQEHREVFAHVFTRQTQRPSQFPKAAPCQRLRSKSERTHRMAVTKAALAIPEVGVSIRNAFTSCTASYAQSRYLSTELVVLE